MAHLTQRFDDAFRYAHEVHGAQTKKGTSIPYVAHLMGVASIVLDDGGDENEAIAALLHDGPEDHGGRERLEDIRARFGNQVAKIVEDCTDSWATPPEPWAERKLRVRSTCPTPGGTQPARVGYGQGPQHVFDPSGPAELRRTGVGTIRRQPGRCADVLPDAGTRVSRSGRRTPRGRARAHRARDRAGDGLLTLPATAGQVLEHSLPMVDLSGVQGRTDRWARHESQAVEQRQYTFFGTLLKANDHDDHPTTQR